MSYDGLQVTSTFVDEAGSITVDMLKAMNGELIAKLAPGRVVSVLEVPCSLCGAPVGEHCRQVRRHVNWVNGKHTERMFDAQLATEAVRALNPA